MRPATEEDLPRIVEIYNSTIPSRIATADTVPVTVDEKRQWFKAHNSTSRPLFVEEQDGAIVAWMSFQDFYGRPAYEKTAELSIYIDKNHKGKGLGTMLLQNAIDIAPTLNIKNIVSFIFSHNEASVALMSKFGFKQWALLADIAEMDNNEYSLAIYGLKIDGHA